MRTQSVFKPHTITVFIGGVLIGVPPLYAQILSVAATADNQQSNVQRVEPVAVTSTDIAHLRRIFVGNRCANTPKLQASLAATYRWSALNLPQFKTTLGIQHIRQRWGNQGNTISLLAYIVLDLGSGYELTKRTSVSFNVRNLTDVTYYTAMQSSNDRADQAMMGNRRLMQIGFTHRFDVCSNDMK